MDYLVLTNTDLDRFVNNIWEKSAFCLYRKSLRSLNSAHEKWGQKQKCCVYNFVQYNCIELQVTGLSMTFWTKCFFKGIFLQTHSIHLWKKKLFTVCKGFPMAYHFEVYTADVLNSVFIDFCPFTIFCSAFLYLTSSNKRLPYVCSCFINFSMFSERKAYRLAPNLPTMPNDTHSLSLQPEAIWFSHALLTWQRVYILMEWICYVCFIPLNLKLSTRVK